MSLIGFCSLHSVAASQQDHNALFKPKNVAIFYALPKLASEGKSYSEKLSTSNTESVQAVCKNSKKNELYELSAIFNDKLQLLISYLTEDKQELNLNLSDKNPERHIVTINAKASS